METRYAIIIGINDYVNNPLNYCVNDALSVKEVLINNANFLDENIHTIVSNADTSLKDITGKLFETISK